MAPLEINVRYLQREEIAQRPSLVTVDLSFISVSKVLAKLAALAAPGAEFLILVKPQFELERGDVGRGGIVRDPALHQRAIERVRCTAIAAGLQIVAVRPSQLAGAEGNQEFFCTRACTTIEFPLSSEVAAVELWPRVGSHISPQLNVNHPGGTNGAQLQHGVTSSATRGRATTRRGKNSYERWGKREKGQRGKRIGQDRFGRHRFASTACRYCRGRAAPAGVA